MKAEHGPFCGRSIAAIEELEAENLDVALDRFHATRSREYAVADGLFGMNDLAFTDATITVEQPAGTTVLTVSCTFSSPTSNGDVPGSHVSCTSS